jgi:hypothetical protein
MLAGARIDPSLKAANLGPDVPVARRKGPELKRQKAAKAGICNCPVVFCLEIHDGFLSRNLLILRFLERKPPWKSSCQKHIY